jgi:hypothetical protein
MKVAASVFVFLLIGVGVACKRFDDNSRSRNSSIDSNSPIAAATPIANAAHSPAGFPDEADSKNNEEFDGTTSVTKKQVKTDEGTIVLTAIRVAAHPNFDRMVFEFSGTKLPDYEIKYLKEPARSCGSGELLRLTEPASLELRFDRSAAHTEAGEPTIGSPEILPNLSVVKELRSACDFEGEVTWIAGVSAVNKYRVLELKNPTRLVVDIKH